MMSSEFYVGASETREFKLIHDMDERLRAGSPLPHFQNRTVNLRDIRGNVGIYVGLQCQYFTRECPIDVKIAFLCIMSAGAWVQYSDGKQDFDLQTIFNAYDKWDSVKKAIAKKRPIYVKVVNHLGEPIGKQRIMFNNMANFNIVNSFRDALDLDHTRLLYVHEKDMGKVGTLFTSSFGAGTETTYVIPKSVEYYLREEIIDNEGLTHYFIDHWTGSELTTEYSGIALDPLSLSKHEYYGIVCKLTRHYVEMM